MPNDMPDTASGAVGRRQVLQGGISAARAKVQHFADLVVHGPLQATLLMATTTHRGTPPDRFRFRGMHPMFDNHHLRLTGVDRPDDTLSLCTAMPVGHHGMQATAGWS